VFDDHRRPTLFVWIAAGLLVLAVAYRALSDRAPEPPPVAVEDAHGAGAGRAGAGGRTASGAGARGAPRVYVHVAGAVRRPGLYRLPEGARVAAAIARAGGPRRRADLTGTNLAARVADGQQVVVARRGQAVPGGGAVATGGGGAAGTGAGEGGPLLSLATATQAQLEELDGIGPTLAQRILEYRAEHGGFRSVDELAEVDGIGEVRLEALRQAVQP